MRKFSLTFVYVGFVLGLLAIIFQPFVINKEKIEIKLNTLLSLKIDNIKNNSIYHNLEKDSLNIVISNENLSNKTETDSLINVNTKLLKIDTTIYTFEKDSLYIQVTEDEILLGNGDDTLLSLIINSSKFSSPTFLKSDSDSLKLIIINDTLNILVTKISKNIN